MRTAALCAALTACGGAAPLPRATLAPPASDGGSAPPPGSAPTDTPAPVPLPSGADAGRIGRIEQGVAAVVAAGRGGVTFTDSSGHTGSVALSEVAPPSPAPSVAGSGLRIEVTCPTRCPASAQSVLLAFGFAPPASDRPAYRLEGAPGTPHQLAVFVERVFLEALRAARSYVLAVG